MDGPEVVIVAEEFIPFTRELSVLVVRRPGGEAVVYPVSETVQVAEALADSPHRVLSLGVRRDRELRAYGTADEHEAAHGLGPTGIAGEMAHFLHGAGKRAA